jgi:hypothetical protein
MAFVVQKGDRFEIRETAITPAGRRARTLATFKVLTIDVARHAASRASTPITPEHVVLVARSAGAPVAGTRADARAAELLRLLDGGVPLSERLRRLLLDRLGAEPSLPDAAKAAGPWAAASPAERGQVLRDLLSTVDALPPPRVVRNKRFPRLVSR